MPLEEKNSKNQRRKPVTALLLGFFTLEDVSDVVPKRR
jgi:hypothetical protein